MAASSDTSRTPVDRDSSWHLPIFKSTKTSNSEVSRVSSMRNKDKPSKSNIKVVVRIRGPSDRERTLKSPNVVYIPEGSSKEVKFINETYDKREPPTFKFDRVFGAQTSQQEFFEAVAAPLVDEILNGYNCTLFAYGQTCTGKTHTMEGNLNLADNELCSDAGIIPRVLDLLFRKLESEDNSHSVRLSMMEIYNEEVSDLLSFEKNIPKLNLNVDAGGKLQIQGLEEIIVNDLGRGIQLLKEGSSKRHTSSTEVNSKSSRSHCIFTLTVRIKVTLPGSPDVLKEGKLHLVDLAGSEDAKTTGTANAQTREAGAINQSLLALGRVINALATKEDTNGPIHVPYRESKLTRILKDSLGGKTKTCLIATVSPCKLTLEETRNTLKYASKAMKIINTPITNQKVAPASEIRRLKDEVIQIRKLYENIMLESKKRVSYEEHNKLKSDNMKQSLKIDELQENIILLKEDSLLAFSERNKTLSALEAKNDVLVKTQEELRSNRTALKRIQERHGITEAGLEEAVLLLTEKVKEGDIAQVKLEEIQKAFENLKINNENFIENEIKFKTQVNSLTERIVSKQNEIDFLCDKLERLAKSENANHSIIYQIKNSFDSLQNKLSDHLSDFSSKQSSFTHRIETQLMGFLEDHIDRNRIELEDLEADSFKVKEDSDKFKKYLKDKALDSLTTISKLNITCGKIESICQEHQSQNSSLKKNSRLIAKEEISSFISKLTEQHEAIYLIFKNYQSTIHQVLSGHRSDVEKLLSNVHSSEQKELEYWKFQTNSLRSSLEIYQKEVPLRIQELKASIISSIDKYTTFTQETYDLSSRFVQESDSHLKYKCMDEYSSSLLSESLFDNSFNSITTENQKVNSQIFAIKSEAVIKVTELPTLVENIIRDTSDKIENQSKTFHNQISDEVGLQRTIISGFSTQQQENFNSYDRHLNDIEMNLEAYGSTRRLQLDHQAAIIDDYSISVDGMLSEFIQESEPVLESCKIAITESDKTIDNLILQTHPIMN